MSPWEIERIKRIRRYSQLFRTLMKVSLMRHMAYRPHFFMMILGKIIRMALLFFFFQAIFSKVSRIGDWTFDQVLLLFATFHIVDYLISITFHRNLAFGLPRKVQTGDLDSRMILPVNLLFFVSFEDLDMIDFFSFLPTLGFLLYVFYRLDFAFTWVQLLIYVLLLANALVFLYAVILIVATTCFWTTQSYGLAIIFDNLMRIGRYPLDIFEGFWRALFIYFLPLVLIAQFPSQALWKTLSLPFTLFALLITGFFLVLALRFWKWGLKSYLSAST